MNQKEQHRALQTAVTAALEAGRLMRRNAHVANKVDAATRHDIKLELDVRCQALIQRRLLEGFPTSAVLGEEGVAGDARSPLRWVVDPIDGTVNFTYGIPHACESVALDLRDPNSAGGYRTVVGVVYEPFAVEL